MTRVSDEVLASVCGIIDKTEGIGWGEETFGESLRLAALDLQDERAEIAQFRAALDGVCEWISRECVVEGDAPDIGRVVPGCQGIVELIGEVLEGGRWRGDDPGPDNKAAEAAAQPKGG